MKKSWKIFAIVCGSVAGLGLVLCLISFAMGFRLSDVRNYTGVFGWFGHYDYDDYQDNSDVDTSGTGEEFTGISELDIDVTQVEVKIEPYEGKSIKVEHANINSRLKLRIYQDNQKLIVETNSKLNLTHSSGIIKIYIPKDLNFKDAELSIGAGKLSAEGIQASALDVEVGAGSINVSNFVTEELSASCAAGEMILSGDSKREADIECGVGSASYQAAGKETDFNYEIECGIGSVQVGGSTFSGLAMDKELMNGANKEMSISCDVGNVIVSFDQN